MSPDLMALPVYFVSGPAAGMPGEVDHTPCNPVGAERMGSDGYIYKYLQGVADTTAGSWIAYGAHGGTVGLDTDVATTLVSMVAVATAATGANTYGWYGIDGVFAARAGTVTANAKVFATATVFICDAIGPTGNQIMPAVWRSADDGTGWATVEIHRPYCSVA